MTPSHQRPSETNRNRPMIGDTFVLEDHNSWRVTAITASGSGCELRKLDKDGQPLEGPGNGRYIPSDVLSRMKLEKVGNQESVPVQKARAGVERTLGKARHLDSVVVWLEDSPCLTQVYARENKSGSMDLQNQSGEAYGSIDQKTLNKYQQLGRDLEARLPRNFEMRSLSKATTFYRNCNYIGINLVTGEIVVAGKNAEGNGVKKQFSDEQELRETML